MTQSLTRASCVRFAYASIWLILKSRFGQYLNPDGKSAEKAAAQFCAIALNSKENLTEDILTFLEYLFRYYDRFKVRYEENDGLWNAVRYQIHPVNAKTAVWIFKNLKVFYDLNFDVFDSKWDLLAQELERTRYLEQFSGQLLAQKDLSTKELNRWIDRYHTLTGLEYVDSFAKHYRDKALMDNDYAANSYVRDMEQERVYAGARKRLKSLYSGIYGQWLSIQKAIRHKSI